MVWGPCGSPGNPVDFSTRKKEGYARSGPSARRWHTRVVADLKLQLRMKATEQNLNHDPNPNEGHGHAATSATPACGARCHGISGEFGVGLDVRAIARGASSEGRSRGATGPSPVNAASATSARSANCCF